MAGFVGKFADDCCISYRYASSLNIKRNSFSQCTVKNFSHDALDILLSAPEELREEIVSSGKPVTVAEVKEAKEAHREIQDTPEFKDIKQSYDDNDIGIFDVVDEVKTRKASMPVVPEYDVAQTMGALKGIAENYGKRYEGSTEDAASILFEEVVKGYHVDDVGMSISRDYVKWLLSLKRVLDLAEPDLLDFLKDKPNLKIVN
jgi:hypothetical protein